MMNTMAANGIWTRKIIEAPVEQLTLHESTFDEVKEYCV
jgi:hypothetical protein